MTSQTGRLAPGAVTAASAYTPRERKLILTFAIIGALIESMELNLLSFPLRDLAGSFSVTNQAVVGVITLQSIASIAGGLLFGWLADRHGRKLTYVAFTALYSIAAVVGGFITDFGVFTASRAVAGLAMGGAFGVIFAMFAESWRSPKRGLMGAVLQGMFIAGTLITQLSSTSRSRRSARTPAGARGFVGIGVGCLLIAGTAAIWLPESKLWQAARSAPRRSEDGAARVRPDAALVRGGLFLTLCTTGVFAASYSYITFAPTFLREVAGASLTTSTLVLTVGTLLGIASYLVAGRCSGPGRPSEGDARCGRGRGAGLRRLRAAGLGQPAAGDRRVDGLGDRLRGLRRAGHLDLRVLPDALPGFGSGATYYVARGRLRAVPAGRAGDRGRRPVHRCAHPWWRSGRGRGAARPPVGTGHRQTRSSSAEG